MEDRDRHFSRRGRRLSLSAIDRRSFLLSSAAAAGAVLGPWVPKVRAEVGGDFELMAWEGCDLHPECSVAHGQQLNVRLTTIAAPDDVTAKLSGNNPFTSTSLSIPTGTTRSTISWAS